MFLSLSPLITVETIEPCLPFWTDHLGFEMVASVPHGDGLGFAMLVRDRVSIMYQTRASVADDAPEVLERIDTGRSALFIKVEALDELIEALERAETEVVVPRRTTFYGTDEIFVAAPCGSVVGLAADVAEG